MATNKYAGESAITKFIELIISVLPSKEITATEVQDMYNATPTS